MLNNTTDTATARPNRLPEEELIDLHAVEAEFQDVEGLRDALTIIRRSPEWPKPRAVNAVAELINQIHDAVTRVRFAIDGHPEPYDERHPAVLSMSRLNAEVIAVLPDDERDWLAEECKRVLSIVTGSHCGDGETGGEQEAEEAEDVLSEETKAYRANLQRASTLMRAAEQGTTPPVPSQLMELFGRMTDKDLDKLCTDDRARIGELCREWAKRAKRGGERA